MNIMDYQLKLIRGTACIRFWFLDVTFPKLMTIYKVQVMWTPLKLLFSICGIHFAIGLGHSRILNHSNTKLWFNHFNKQTPNPLLVGKGWSFAISFLALWKIPLIPTRLNQSSRCFHLPQHLDLAPWN